MTLAAAQAPDADTVLTRTPRQALRRRAGWISLVALVVLVAVTVVVLLNSSTVSKDPLDAGNPAPQGSRALVEVLKQHGVDVVTTGSLKETRAALGDPADTTVMLYDPQSIMTAEQRDSLLSLGTEVVAVEPDLLALRDLAPGVGLVGEVSGSFRADCSVEAVRKAGTVTASGLGYRLTPDTGDPATACLSRDGASGLIRLDEGDRAITVLGLGTALQNGTITRDGDAALALNLLGSRHTLIWYISTIDDYAESSSASLADVTPAWVTPLLVLLALAGVAAIVWRGRRFGAIVVENLPVVVRASETMEGRARLYSRANARLHALDSLRVGTVDRLAVASGLPRSATVEEVIDAVAALTGRDRSAVAAVLLDEIPRGDADLVRLSDELLALEADTAAAVLR